MNKLYNRLTDLEDSGLPKDLVKFYNISFPSKRSLRSRDQLEISVSSFCSKSTQKYIGTRDCATFYRLI